MKTAIGFGFLFAAVGCVLLSLAITGCEKEVMDVAIQPSFVILPSGSNSTTFTAVVNSNNDFTLPLTWSVEDAALGEIFSSGLDAVYMRIAGTGTNIIKVETFDGRNATAELVQQ